MKFILRAIHRLVLLIFAVTFVAYVALKSWSDIKDFWHLYGGY